MVESIEIKFSDRSKISVTYNYRSAPKELKALSEKLSVLALKLEREIPAHFPQS